MRRIDDKRCVTCQGELTTRDKGSIGSSVYRKAVSIIEFEGICRCLLHVEKAIIELLHACGICNRRRYELSCTDSISVDETMGSDCHYDRHSVGDCTRNKLTDSEVTR